VRGFPVLLLTTTGRKSGERTRPMGYLSDWDRFQVFGSNGGSDHPPAWSLNLHAHPDGTVEAGARTLSVTASDITGEEYETAWDRYVATNPGSPVTERKPPHLPIFILEDRAKVVTAQPSATTT